MTTVSASALGATLADALSKFRDVGASSRTPREVYKLHFDGCASPQEARHAVAALAKVHASGELSAFRELLTTVFPYRECTFGYEMWRNAMPAIALEIDTIEELAAAEVFCLQETIVQDTPPIGLLVKISIPTDAERYFLLRAASFVQRLATLASNFRVTMVNLALGRLNLTNEHVLRAASRLCDALLRQFETITWFNVSLTIPSGGEDEDGGVRSFLALGELFQALCRVGRPRLREFHEELLDDDCSTLRIEIERNANSRITAMLWSAVAYSRGYSRLYVDNAEFNDVKAPRNQAAETLNTLYFSTIPILRTSDVRRLEWTRPEILKNELDVMERLQAAHSRSQEPVGAVLWDREWSVSRHGRVFETTTLNEAIVRQHGWVILEPGYGEWIDLFVPGFAQCSVKRAQWNRLQRIVHVEADATPLAKLSLQTIDENARLISILGSALTELTIKGPCKAPALLTIFESCPRLRNLQVTSLKAPEKPLAVDPMRLLSRQLKVLELEFCQTPTPPQLLDPFFASVLPVIGANVTSLRIKNPSKENWLSASYAPIFPFDQSFQVLATSCPQLDMLMLERLEMSSLEGLIRAYQNERTRLSSLRLVECPLESSSLIRFAEVLRDPACRGARFLDFLLIKQTSRRPEDRARLTALDPSSLRELLVTAQVNRSLSTMLLLATRTGPNENDADAITGELNLFRAQDHGAHQIRCRTQCVVALVSVLEARQWPWNDEAIRQITRFVTFKSRKIHIGFE